MFVITEKAPTRAVVAAFNQEKALVGAFSVITNIRMELFQALLSIDFIIYLAELDQDSSALHFTRWPRAGVRHHSATNISFTPVIMWLLWL